jgi:hypothetical protein
MLPATRIEYKAGIFFCLHFCRLVGNNANQIYQVHLFMEIRIMKLTSSLIILFLAIVGIPFIVSAAEIPDYIGPEIIKIKMGDNTLNFYHRKHQKRNNNECFHCHKPQEWKIKKWDKEVAHEICIACHDLNDKGPVECKECHGAQAKK